MRITLALGVIVTTAALVSASVQEKSPPTTPRKGDAIVVKGCLRGAALEATEIAGAETAGSLAPDLTFRLTGDKSLLRELREKHDSRLVEITGLLKSNLPQQPGQSAKLGRMRVTIGSPSTNPASPDAEARRSLPVLEVKSFDGSTTTCGR